MAPATTLTHEALRYRGTDELLDTLLPFVRAGVRDGCPVLVAMPGPNLAVLRDALGADADHVDLVDMTFAGRNPGRIIPSVLLAFASRHPGRPVRIVGEPIWPGRTELEYPACVQHEALINVALAEQPVHVLCPYDAELLDIQALEDAERSHPVFVEGEVRSRSPRFADPVELASAYNLPLPEAPVNAVTMTFAEPAALRGMRRFLAAEAERAGLTERLPDLVIAVNEVATNSLRHAGGPGVVRIWPEEGSLVCEVSDQGMITDPLAGRRPPTAAAGVHGGYGLMLVNHL